VGYAHSCFRFGRRRPRIPKGARGNDVHSRCFADAHQIGRTRVKTHRCIPHELYRVQRHLRRTLQRPDPILLLHWHLPHNCLHILSWSNSGLPRKTAKTAFWNRDELDKRATERLFDLGHDVVLPAYLQLSGSTAGAVQTTSHRIRSNVPGALDAGSIARTVSAFPSTIHDRDEGSKVMAQVVRFEGENLEWALRPGDHVHFVGIGGIGLSAIALILLQRGYAVSGSDLQLSPITHDLVELGAIVHEGHREENIGEANVVVASSAVPRRNPEIVEARNKSIPVIKRGQMLAWLMKGQYGIAVAGTHGKTTTSAMIALILKGAGLDPSIIVGGIMPELGTNAKDGKGHCLVLEADEYDRTFLELSPQVAVVTSIEMDHPDCFTDLTDMSNAFRSFLLQVPAEGLVMACGDDVQVRKVIEALRDMKVSTYGLEKDVDWKAISLQGNALGGNDFQVVQNGKDKGRFELSIPGIHNVSNALAAIGVADHLGLDLAYARDTLRHFQGVKRRFEVKGEAEGVTVVDDYAHHPSEIRATLAAARQRYAGRRIWAVFQPHTYSRTKTLLTEFATAFDDAERVIITAIYAAREKDDLGIGGKDLVQMMTHPQALHIADLPEASSWVSEKLRPGDVLITMGAGDVWRVGEEILARLRHEEKANR
jgi:UDP-N-acetylmuramate--alanine ligase